MKAGVAGLSGPLALVLLLPMEAGVPIPVPADLVMFAVGEHPTQWSIAGGGIVLGTSLLRSIMASRKSESVLITPAPEAIQEER